MKTQPGKDTSGKGTTRRMDEQGLKLLGQRLKEIRRQQGMSQEDLADISGLALSQVGRIERGVINATLSSVFALCRALEVEVSELFTFKLDKQDHSK